MSLCENLLNIHTNDIKALSLIPSSGGVFEIKVNEKLIFSKKVLNRFPNENEIEDIIEEEYIFENS